MVVNRGKGGAVTQVSHSVPVVETHHRRTNANPNSQISQLNLGHACVTRKEAAVRGRGRSNSIQRY
jgi:hypothetical protein